VSCRRWRWFWFVTSLFKKRVEVVLITSSRLVLMEMIVMREYIHVEGRDREAIIVA
jgi:hypothetical protein